MPPRVQAKLLRFLQDRQAQPLGGRGRGRSTCGSWPRPASYRRSIREDLVGRLGAEPIVIPPLRNRIEDVGALVAYLGGPGFPGVDPGAFRALCLYEWPRNVRELADVLEARRHARRREQGRPRRPAGGGAKGAGARAPGDRAAITACAARARRAGARPARAGGNVASVAEVFDRQWNVVQRWLRRYGLNAGRYRE